MELLIKKVSAPLNIKQMDNIESNVVYEFNYETSDFDINKPNEFINYLENVGCDLDIFVSSKTPYEEREKLLLLYFNTERSFKVLSMITTLCKILFMFKNLDVKKKFKNSFFSDQECLLFIANNKSFVKKISLFFDSLFVAMIYLSSSKSFKEIKQYYSLHQISTEHISSNTCSILLLPEFYDYYKNGIDKDNIKYYDYTYNNVLVDGSPLINIVCSENNFIIHLLNDLHNKSFQQYLQDNYKLK